MFQLIKSFYAARRVPDQDYWETSLGASEFIFPICNMLLSWTIFNSWIILKLYSNLFLL